MLPADLPGRDTLIEKCDAHLELITEANRQFNLTRILSPREAAIKHVLDCVLPWRLFAGERHVMDAGTGAGLPGIPLAIVFPETRFTLVEATQKKARFVESAAASLGLANIRVDTSRVEDLVKTLRPSVITARAFAPLSRAIPWLAPALREGARALLYKGPDAEAEIEEARAEARKRRLQMRIVDRYDLPDAMGSRNIVEVSLA